VTPTGSAFVQTLKDEAAYWDDLTTTDGNALMRHRAEARRNELDSLVQRLPRILAAVEAEAIEEYRGVAAWLDEGAGIGEAA
jgi:hypothetical protein